MLISGNDFTPRPGIINKEGCLPDPLELVCIEVPKVFDQCLIKRCLKFHEGPDTKTTDEELRSDLLNNPKIFLGCRDFNIRLLAFDKLPLRGHHGYHKIIVHFIISFYADFLDRDGKQHSEFFEINRSETIDRLYCPDSIAKIASSTTPSSKDLEAETLKLELVAECLDGNFERDCDGRDFLDITLGFHLIVKCELLVQLLIPAYGYCPVPKPCKDVRPKNPCEDFNCAPSPKFYPDQKLKPLFQDDDKDPCHDDKNHCFDDFYDCGCDD